MAVAALAEAQCGVFTRHQALASGMAARTLDRRIETQAWRRLLPGVYAIGGVPPSWRQWLVAVLFWGGGEACASHRAAARLWGLDGVETAPAEITLPFPRHSPHPEVVVHSTDCLAAHDVATVAPFRLTGTTRTLVDLGSTVDPGILERALDDALRRGLTSLPRLRFRLTQLRRPGRRGVAALARLIDERDPSLPMPESRLEARVIEVLRTARLPMPVRQHEVTMERRVIARVDLAYPEHLLAVECDGYRYHSGKAAWEKDLRRRNHLTALGWRVLHVTWDDVERWPLQVAERIAAALDAASVLSWQPAPRPPSPPQNDSYSSAR